MRSVESVADLREAMRPWRLAGERIAFVPTMGNLHDGHFSLVELAREAGTGYELAFFDMLGRRIQELCRAQSTCFELLGLEPCVKLLRARKSWSRDCDALRIEIVSFAREQTGTAAADTSAADNRPATRCRWPRR